MCLPLQQRRLHPRPLACLATAPSLLGRKSTREHQRWTSMRASRLLHLPNQAEQRARHEQRGRATLGLLSHSHPRPRAQGRAKARAMQPLHRPLQQPRPAASLSRTAGRRWAPIRKKQRQRSSQRQQAKPSLLAAGRLQPPRPHRAWAHCPRLLPRLQGRREQEQQQQKKKQQEQKLQQQQQPQRVQGMQRSYVALRARLPALQPPPLPPRLATAPALVPPRASSWCSLR